MSFLVFGAGAGPLIRDTLSTVVLAFLLGYAVATLGVWKRRLNQRAVGGAAIWCALFLALSILNLLAEAGAIHA